MREGGMEEEKAKQKIYEKPDTCYHYSKVIMLIILEKKIKEKIRNITAFLF